MRHLASACEALAGTTKKLQKIAIVADYLKSRTPEEAGISAVFLSGRPFPVWEETTLQVGGSLLWRMVAELAEKDEATLTALYRRLGDLGAVAGEVLPEKDGQGLGVFEVNAAFRRIAGTRGASAKSGALCELRQVSQTRGYTIFDIPSPQSRFRVATASTLSARCSDTDRPAPLNVTHI